jgi:histidine triad (HIT) family protein
MKTTKSHGFNVVLNEGKSAGQVIFHVHAHVVPRFEGDPVNFRVPREKYAEGEASRIAKKILEASQAK